jgi:hypothetical protein
MKDALGAGPRGLRWVADVTHARIVQVLLQVLTVWGLFARSEVDVGARQV